MTIPRIDTLYKYNGYIYILRYMSFPTKIWLQTIPNELNNNLEFNSELIVVNYWKFAFNAKFMRRLLVNENY